MAGTTLVARPVIRPLGAIQEDSIMANVHSDAHANVTGVDPATGRSEGLLRGRRNIAAARGRGSTPSDGGGTGKSDGND
ncbi:hypothetical protein [Streptomyces sp. URMC 123]|uniref:hypothetical protein n=1 Tax=Streptomyces sp. URMC 123 TaxID=3423403 RepID=UPI003F1DF011